MAESERVMYEWIFNLWERAEYAKRRRTNPGGQHVGVDMWAGVSYGFLTELSRDCEGILQHVDTLRKGATP